MTTTARPALDVSKLRADFPILATTVRGRAARVPGQRRHQPEAARRDRGHTSLLRDPERQHPSRRVCAERAGHRGVRGRARRGRAGFSTPARSTRSSSSAAPPRRSTSSRRAAAEPISGQATRCWSPRWSTTPTSCRGRWSCEATGAVLKVIPMNRARRARARRVRAPARGRPQAGGGRPHLELARHDQSGGGADALAHARRRGGAGRRSPRRRPTCRSTSRRWARISTRCRVTRCSVPPESACSTAGRSCSRQCRPIRAAAT